MANFTEKAIKTVFIQMLNERPLSQITVKDIAQVCGINRNTFYYHFSDIPTLLQSIVTEELDSIIQKYPSIDSLQQCLDVAIQFALANKRAILHIYQSVNRDIYEHYFWEVCEHVITAYVSATLDEMDLDFADRRLLIRVLKCEGFGFLMAWLESGMNDEVLEDFNRFCRLQLGHERERLRGLIGK